ncbi:MAG: hypothetical protein ACP5NX_01000 [Candidatus Bilamarchaeaceae archaeon]
MDKITADDALISTDIDRIIKAISKTRRMELKDLESETHISHKNLEKWVRILEDEGYVKIEYRLTRTYVVWTGEQDAGVYAEVPIEKKNHPEPKAMEPKEEFLPELPKEEDIPLEIKEEPEAKPIPETAPPKDEKRRAHIPLDVPEDEGGDSPELQKLIEDEMIGPVRHDGPEARFRTHQQKEKAVLKEETVPEIKEAGVKQRLKESLDEINRQRMLLEELKKEKEGLYTRGYLDTEKRLDAGLGTLNQRILEKEERILGLKEKIFALPHEIEDVERLQKTIKKVEKDGKALLEGTRSKVDAFLREIEETGEEVEGKVTTLRERISKERNAVAALSKSREQYLQDEEKLSGALEEMGSKIEDLKTMYEAAGESLKDTVEARMEITEMLNEVNYSMERKEKQVDELEAQLGEIRKVESWIREYLDDYERKIDSIADYIRNSGDEIAEVRESAEKEYLRKYLNELERIASEYEKELDGVKREEGDVERRMRDTKARIEELLVDSQDLMRKLRAESAGETYEEVARRKKARSDEVRRMFEEKQAQGEKLSEDVKGTKRGPKKGRQTGKGKKR